MPDSIKEAIENIANAAPFLGVVGGKVQVDTSKVLETLIAVGLGGALMAFVALQVLESKFDDFKINISSEMEKLDNKLEQMYRDIYRPSIGND
ncbi:MAG: hypothetical protein KAV87_20865 [Desulfobacteraceae bacterium]|nr:hypothetical protein [Desulfobacteraceae bacterium]